jgi:hypothetical protein
MKKIAIIASFACICFAQTVFGQDIPQSQVPSVIVNNFQQAFPKAYDVDWEMDGEYYKVEFETGLLGSDHDVWYDKAGKLIRHKEEISKSELPQKVLDKIKSEFGAYRVDDVKKITEGTTATYTVELKKMGEEWKVAFDSEGNVLSKLAD